MDAEILVIEKPEKTSFFITKQELSIVTAVSNGKTSREIAVEYGLNPRVVETERLKVMKRLECRNMPQLIRLLCRKKILL